VSLELSLSSFVFCPRSSGLLSFPPSSSFSFRIFYSPSNHPRLPFSTLFSPPTTIIKISPRRTSNLLPFFLSRTMLAHPLAISLALSALFVDAAPIHTQIGRRIQSEGSSPPSLSPLLESDHDVSPFPSLLLDSLFLPTSPSPFVYTSYLCPSNVKTLPSPSGYLSCGLFVVSPPPLFLLCSFRFDLACP